MSWQETASPSFVARHASRDSDDVVRMLELLEHTRALLARWYDLPPDPTPVVVHPSAQALALARPGEVLARRLTAAPGRRYAAGAASASEIHTLAPRLLAERASNVAGSRELLERVPAALDVRLVLGRSSPVLPPPLRARSLIAWRRWGWLAAGAAQWYSGQTAHAHAAIARRLREGTEPRFPPAPPDAGLLGGTVVDMLAREEGRDAVAELVRGAGGDPRAALVRAFHGRELVHTAGSWRIHLARMAGER